MIQPGVGAQLLLEAEALPGDPLRLLHRIAPRELPMLFEEDVVKQARLK